MKKTTRILMALVLFSSLGFSQEVPIGQWRVHLPYNDVMSVTEAKNRIYCACSKGLFFYDKNDNRIERLSKISGLSDLEICGSDTTFNVINGGVKYNPVVDMLMICYKNANIDIIKGGKQIINLSFIKDKNIPGKKVISHITFIGDKALLSCSFGIQVVNMGKITGPEFGDTYYIGLGSKNREVYDVASDGSYLYAATDSGVYKADINDPHINVNSAWSFVDVRPGCSSNCPIVFNHIIYFANHIIANCTHHTYDVGYIFDGTSWSQWDSLQTTRKDMQVCDNGMVICDAFGIYLWEDLTGRSRILYDYAISKNPLQAIIDKDKYIWIADNGSGLVRYTPAPDNRYEKIYPNGPGTNSSWAMDIRNNNVWVVPGGFTSTFAPSYNIDGLFTFQNSTWANFTHNNTPKLDYTFHDFVHVAINPTNPSQVFMGSWGSGIVEFDNNVFTQSWEPTTSGCSLQKSNIAGDNGCYIGGMSFDTLGNLWIVNSRANNLVAVKSSKGTWYNYYLQTWNSSAIEMTNAAVDKNNQFWAIFRNGNVGVFNYNNTLEITTDDQSKVLTTGLNQGHLPAAVHALAVDHDGAMWVGTDAGVAVFYSPGDIFSNNNFDCQQILIEQDGHAQYLLGAESVTAIAVDGANRKWFGTLNGGAFLMSADGITQIYHFDDSNSPLLSKNIQAISINQLTGEVFFATDKGIASFKSTATEGADDCNIFAFPNPVRSTYNGVIGIKGLVANMNVKITDITGTLVYETTANGGEAIWNGTNFKGQRPSTGVYLILCTNEDGSKTCTGKLLFIN
ncbi:MAG: T9SS type A sorting domain-containing protein [Bacteroidota bacterium]